MRTSWDGREGVSVPPHLTAVLLVRVEVSDQPFIAACVKLMNI